MVRTTFGGSFTADALTTARLIKKDLEKALALVSQRHPGTVLYTVNAPKAPSTKSKSKSKGKGKATKKKGVKAKPKSESKKVSVKSRPAISAKMLFD
jgi:hypothetical protein